jgi:beta-aspartyl-peptidase (threonine type)
MKHGVIVHGGAGDIPDELVAKHKKGVKLACSAAYQILQDGGSALDAVEASILTMEDNMVFDAGTGSFFNELGEIEMDAMIATDQWKIGSVCAIQNVKNPIKVARLVAEKTKHVMLVGPGAFKLAIDHGIPFTSEKELGFSPELALRFKTNDISEILRNRAEFGTVGCICLDQKGHFAIGVSTGGSVLKHQGRVGDSALWGAGGYVDTVGGAVGTGLGEDLIRVLLSKTVVDHLSNAAPPEIAAAHGIALLETRTESEGGVISMNRKGFGYAFNTAKMSIAYRDDSMNSIKVIINKE